MLHISHYINKPWPIINGVGLLCLLFVITEPFNLQLLFYNTIPTGGDGGSWFQIATHLKESLIPAGRLFGWDQGNFFGYSNLQHYFVLPFLLAVLLSYLFPLAVSLKLVTVSGFFLMPLAVFWALQKMNYKKFIPLSGAWLILIFLFHERYSMFGGNLLSTLAGEFCYSIAFTLMMMYLAMLFNDIKRQKVSLLTGALLGLIGLSHAFVFFVVILMPVYFLLIRPTRMTVKIVAINYLVGFLMMAFWVLPMLTNLEYTTPISLNWRFVDIAELLHSLLYEIVFIAAVISLFSFFKRFRTLEGGFFVFGILVSVLLYFIATALQVPDIRFFPPILFFSIMLIIDSLSRFVAFQKLYQNWVALISFCLCILFSSIWVFDDDNKASDWFEWNYSGYEAKPAFIDGRAENLFSELRGAYNDPRVAWEQGRHTDDFGTGRVFENIPLFTGRASTEGIHYASSLLSLPITILNGEYSQTPASPSANIYSHFFIDSLPERFRMLNIREFIAYSPQITELMNENDEFEIVTEQSPYTLFRWKNHNTQYVSSSRYKPHLVKAYDDWKHRFNNWFRRGDNLDLALVNGAYVNDSSREKYFSNQEIALLPSGMIDDVERIPLKSAVVKNEKIENFRMSFETDSPGLPHIVKVSYSPNWVSMNSEPIHMIAPGFMMIYPATNQVELIYVRHWSEFVGLGLGLSGLFAIIYFSFYKQRLNKMMSSSYLETGISLFLFVRRPLLYGVLIIMICVSVWSYQAKRNIHSDYMAGTRSMVEGNFEEAIGYFKKNATTENILHVDDVDVPTSLYSLARVYRRLGKLERAKTEFNKLIKYYPRWIYIDEIYWHLGSIALEEAHLDDAKTLFSRCLMIDRFGTNAKRCENALKTMP